MLTVSYPMCHPPLSLEGTKSLSNVLIHKQNSFLTKLKCWPRLGNDTPKLLQCNGIWEFPADFLDYFCV